MSIHDFNNQKIPISTEAYYEELACQEEKYLEETEEELHSILTSDDASPLRTRGYVWKETIIVQTSDGPENAMFCATPKVP